jgi:hypothetical protein
VSLSAYASIPPERVGREIGYTRRGKSDRFPDCPRRGNIEA